MKHFMHNARATCARAGFILLMMSNIPVNAAPEGLAPCPLTPNCVSSQASDTGHFIAPISYTGPADQAMQRMQQVLAQLERSTLVGHTATYLHFEVRSMLFRFVDDIECLLDPAAGVIHIRSASRVGLSDLGVNRRRVEHIREAFGKT